MSKSTKSDFEFVMIIIMIMIMNIKMFHMMFLPVELFSNNLPKH